MHFATMTADHKLDVDRAILNEIEEICSYASSIEDLIVAWVGHRRELTSAYNESLQMPSVSFGFVFDDRVLGFATVEVSDLLRRYGPFETLNETTFDLADDDRFVADEDWFSRRNRRLGVHWLKKHEHWVAPPKAIINMLLSYVFSSWGVVKIQEHWTKKMLEDPCYKFSLVFFGKDGEKGWHEQVLVRKNELGACSSMSH